MQKKLFNKNWFGGEETSPPTWNKVKKQFCNYKKRKSLQDIPVPSLIMQEWKLLCAENPRFLKCQPLYNNLDISHEFNLTFIMCMKNPFKDQVYLLITLKIIYIIIIIHSVGENIIATTKIRNNYSAFQSFKFPILRKMSSSQKWNRGGWIKSHILTQIKKFRIGNFSLITGKWEEGVDELVGLHPLLNPLGLGGLSKMMLVYFVFAGFYRNFIFNSNVASVLKTCNAVLLFNWIEGNWFPKYNVEGGGGLLRTLDIFGICWIKQKFLVR